MCPWQINFARTDVYYYDKKQPNTWNPEGNGFILDDESSVRIKCYESNMQFPAFECGCRQIKVGKIEGSESPAADMHQDKLGGQLLIYITLPHIENVYEDASLKLNTTTLAVIEFHFPQAHSHHPICLSSTFFFRSLNR